jgi:signal transduction histidine kinase
LGFANHIHAAAEHMHELVQDLLDLAKFDMNLELKKDVMDLNALASEIADEFQPQAEIKKQSLQVEKVNNQPVVQGDSLRLRQALRNLIGNAIKYTPEGGSIQVVVENNNDNVILHVKDTGYGIPPDDLPFIFDRFYRVRNDDVKDIEGNGLGLAIVKAIIEQHGGQISVESEPGKGSCFTFTLPLMQQEVPIVLH